MNNIVIDELKRRIRSMQNGTDETLYRAITKKHGCFGFHREMRRTRMRHYVIFLYLFSGIGKVYVIGAVGNVCLQSFVFRKEFVL